METKINTGAIFKNDNKKAENHPDYKGKVNVNGKDMEVALWLKTSAKGVKFLSRQVLVNRTCAKRNKTNKPIEQPANDDLPF
jgi:uncharacterized protein (DUF736 family)